MIFNVKYDAQLDAADLDDAFRQLGTYYLSLADGDTDHPTPWINGQAAISAAYEEEDNQNDRP